MNAIQDKLGLKRITLRELEPDLDNVLIVGIIIGKQRPRKFNDTRSGSSGEIRAVWNFTLRDSPRDYINITFWGTVDEVYTYNDKFYIGDVVEITKPQITIRKFNDSGEQFRPMVTSPFHITLGSFSKITPLMGDCSMYTKLLLLPTKPMAGYVPLRDIHNEGAIMKDRFIDILVAVRNIADTRSIKTKHGDDMQLREVVVFDHTHPTLKLTIWDPDIMTRASAWKPRLTVLFITDVKVEWSAFMKTYTASLTSRSIITENPIGKEAANLAVYARNAPLETSAILNQLTMSLPNPATIKNVMSIQQINNLLNGIKDNPNHSNDQQITACVYAIITKLDLDGLTPNVSIKCFHCKSFVKTDESCQNVGCPTVLGIKPNDVEMYFDIRINLTDHTGTLINCRLSGQTAELVLGCSVYDFLHMSDDEKTHLKWKYLMERCAVRILILPINQSSPVISILSIDRANAIEAVQKMPVY